MSPSEDRLKSLAQEQFDLDHEPDIDAKVGDSGISSLDAVAFIKKVGEAFGVDIPPEDAAKLENLRGLAQYLDERSE